MVQEWDPKSFTDSKIPFTKYNFEKSFLSFELNAFEFQRSSEKAYRRDDFLLNLKQIYLLYDSVNIERKNRYEKIENLIKKEIALFNDTLNLTNNPTKENYIHKITKGQSTSGIKKDNQTAIRKLDQLSNHIKIIKSKETSSINYINDLKIEWNRKFTLSYAVFMLFFLGGPLGAIVKRGGLGWPVITAILIFLAYFMLTRAGEEMAANYNLGPNIGMWLSAICITPISLFIFIKANQDARLFDIEWYNKIWRKIIRK